MRREAPIDELLWRAGRGVRRGALTGWARGFALSLMRQAKRPDWAPSAKQERVLRQLIDEIGEPNDPILDRADTAAE